MSGVAQVNSNANIFQQESMLAELEAEYLKSKKEFDGLLEKMAQIIQEIAKLIQELMAFVGSKTPPTPEQLAQIMGQMDEALGEAHSCFEDCEALSAKTEFAAIKNSLMKETLKTDPRVIGFLKQEITDLKKKELQLLQTLQKDDEIQQSQKKLTKAIAQMLANQEKSKMSELQQLLQEIHQEGDEIKQAQKKLTEAFDKLLSLKLGEWLQLTQVIDHLEKKFPVKEQKS